jgi:cyclopropane-fatty-acyl-phospholipid synthase
MRRPHWPTTWSASLPFPSPFDPDGALDLLLARIQRGTVTLRFEDGPERVYGRGDPFSIVEWSPEATRRTLAEGTVGFGDAYVAGLWHVHSGDLIHVLRALVSARIHQTVKEGMGWRHRARLYAAMVAARATVSRTHVAVCSHYDLGNDFFARWLDDEMTYTCGYARHPDDSLEVMQRQKLDLIFDKIRLRPHHRLLDLGCGWGALALRAAGTRGASVTAVNVSCPQLERLRNEIRVRGLEGRVEAVQGDFRGCRGRFDRITAVGLAEHLGKARLPDLFRTISRCLVPGGVAMVHTIGSADTPGADPWIERRIFPGAHVPTLSELAQGAERNGLRIEHVENLGPHYALTLQHWYRRFQEHRGGIRAEHGERFCRAWELYLAMLIPAFESLSTSLFQVVMTRGPGPSPALHGPVLGSSKD